MTEKAPEWFLEWTKEAAKQWFIDGLNAGLAKSRIVFDDKPPVVHCAPKYDSDIPDQKALKRQQEMDSLGFWHGSWDENGANGHYVNIRESVSLLSKWIAEKTEEEILTVFSKLPESAKERLRKALN